MMTCARCLATKEDGKPCPYATTTDGAHLWQWARGGCGWPDHRGVAPDLKPKKEK